MATSRLRIIVDAVTTGATSALSGLGAATSAATTAIAVGWTAAAAAVGAAAVSTFKTGVAFNALNQQANASFKTILGSAEAAQGMMADLTAFSKQSPFGKDVFIKASQQMLAFGIESQKVVPYLGAIEDAVAAAGGSGQQLSEVAFVMSQISAAGKITGQDLIQFGQRGINAAELIGSQMGKTGAEIKAQITAGTLGADEALDALAAGMESSFGGAAQNVKQTWVGASQSVTAAIRDIGAAMAEPFVSAEGGGLAVEWAGALGDALRALRDIVQEVMPMLVEHFGGALGAITPMLTGFTDLLKNVDVGALFDSLSGLLPALGALTGGFAAMSGGLLSSLPGIGPMFSALSGPIGIVVAAIAGLVATSPELQEMFAGVFKAALDAITPILPVLASLLTVVAGALGRVLTAVAPIIPVLAGLITQIVGGLAPIFVMIVNTLMPPLISIIDALLPVVDAMANVFALLIPPIAQIIGALLPPLITILNLVIAAVAPLIPPVLELSNALLQMAIQAVMPLLPVLVQLLNAFIPILKPILALIGPLAGLIAALSPLITLIGQLAGIIVGALAGALGNLLTGALSKIAPIFEGISDAIGWVIDKLSSFVSWLGRIKIPDWLSNAGSWVGGLFKSAPAPAAMSATYGTFATYGTGRLGMPALSPSTSSNRTTTINVTVNAPLGGGDAIGRTIRDELTKLSRRRTGVQIGGPGVVFG